MNVNDLHDLGRLRPWLDGLSRSCVSVRGPDGLQETITFEGQAVLTKKQWIELDIIANRKFQEAAPVTTFLIKEGTRHQLRLGPEEAAAADAPRGQEPSGPASPKFTLRSLPVPTTHADFRGEDQGALVLACAEASGRVGEAVEDTILGMREAEGIWGLCNHPAVNRYNRLSRLANTVRDMAEGLGKANYYGPYTLLYGRHWKEETAQHDWDEVMAAVPNLTRIRADRLKPWDLVLVQPTPSVVRIVIGLPLTTVWWESSGGYRVLTAMVPLVQTDFHNNLGIAYVGG